MILWLERGGGGVAKVRGACRAPSTCVGECGLSVVYLSVDGVACVRRQSVVNRCSVENVSVASN